MSNEMIELSQSVGKAIGLLEGMSTSISEIKSEQLYLRENMSSSSTVKDLEEKLKHALKDIAELKQEVLHSKSLRAFFAKNWYQFVIASGMTIGLIWGAFEWHQSVQELKVDLQSQTHIQHKEKTEAYQD